MSINLQINEDIKITNDKYNIIIEQRSVPQTGKVAGQEQWVGKSFHSRLEQALLHLLHEDIKGAEASGAPEIIAAIQKAERNIIAALEARREQLSLF